MQPERQPSEANLFHRSTLTECPVCQGLDPDPTNRGFCALCGAVFTPQLRVRMRMAIALSTVGLALMGIAWWSTFRWKMPIVGSLSLLFVAAAMLGSGVFLSRRVGTAMLSALRLRTAPEALRFLKSTTRLHAVMLTLATLALAAATPYYFRVVIPERHRARYESRFAEAIPGYLALAPADELPPEEPIGSAKPKLVVIDKAAGGGSLSAVHFSLPEGLRANSPDEVGTVVLVEWKNMRFGTYGESGIVAYRIHALVNVIDPAKKVILAGQEFQGAEPPAQAPRGGGPGYGTKPVDQIVAYLEELSAQPPTPPE